MYKYYPRLSIVTPSYNQGRFIEDTIKSVINQNYPDLEYIIIDGGSTDNTIEIIKRYEHQLTYWVSEKDEGQSHALKKGFDFATGEIFLWLNSDDMLFPGALKSFIKSYRKDPNAVLYIGSMARCDINGKIYKCISFSTSNKTCVKYGIFNFGQPSTFFKTSVYRAVGGINDNLVMRMDHDLFWRMLACDNSIKKIYTPISVLRDHPDRKWEKLKNKGEEEYLEYKESIKSNSNLILLRSLFKIKKIVNGTYFHSIYLTVLYKHKYFYDFLKKRKG